MQQAPTTGWDKGRSLHTTLHWRWGDQQAHIQKAEVFDHGHLYLDPQQQHWRNPTSYCNLTGARVVGKQANSALLKSSQLKPRALYRGSDIQDKGKAGLIHIMIPTYTGLMMQRMPLHLRGPRNCSKFSLQKWQHPGDLAQWDPETSGSFVCSPRVQKAPRKTFMCIKLHKPTIYQKVNTVCSNILREFSIMVTLHVMNKKNPFQMPSFYMILHSKIWQRLRGDLDNSRDKEQSQVINDSQAYSPVLTVLLQKEAMGSKGENRSTNYQKW